MIRFNNFSALPAEQIEREIAAAARIMRSGWYILGPEVESFEERWADYCGTRFAVGVGNGMDALEIGLRALGIGLGDEVITTPMTAFATVLSIIRSGATPVFADIDSHTALLSLDSVRRCLSKRTRAVMLVHLYGRMSDMDAWTALSKEAGVELIEDCAQSHGARFKGRHAGTWGRFGGYSFYPTKNLGAMGDAGALVCSDEDIAVAARKLRNYGQSERYQHPVLGMNSRLDELHAAVLSTRLECLDEFTVRRRRIASQYHAGIRNGLVVLQSQPGAPENHVHHLFVVNCNQRDRLARHLASGNIETLIHYPVPAHLQPPCAGIRGDALGLGNAVAHGATCLSLPCHPFLKESEVAAVIEAVNAFQ